jgi:chromosome segregation ATPase
MELELVEVRNDLQRVKKRKLMLLKKDRELETARVRASSKIKEHKTAISSLEQEIKNLKASNVPITSQMVSKSASVDKQIQILVTRMRSVEQSNRNYHNVTQKLMAFAHKVHRLLHDDQHRNKHVNTSSSDHTYQVVDCIKGVETGVDNKKTISVKGGKEDHRYS